MSGYSRTIQDNELNSGHSRTFKERGHHEWGNIVNMYPEALIQNINPAKNQCPTPLSVCGRECGRVGVFIHDLKALFVLELLVLKYGWYGNRL